MECVLLGSRDVVGACDALVRAKEFLDMRQGPLRRSKGSEFFSGKDTSK